VTDELFLADEPFFFLSSSWFPGLIDSQVSRQLEDERNYVAGDFLSLSDLVYKLLEDDDRRDHETQKPNVKRRLLFYYYFSLHFVFLEVSEMYGG
jgi:hypothetical protein